MIRLSIVVPAIGPQTDLDETLVSILENRPDRCEIIVPHLRGYVDPYGLDDEIVFVECPKHANAIEALNSGFDHSQGAIVHWMMPGTLATQGWTDAILDHFQETDVDVVSPKLVNKERPNRLVSVGVQYRPSGGRMIVGRGARKKRARKKWSASGPMIASGFCRRSLVESHGLPSHFGVGLADVAWSASLEAADIGCVVASDCEMISKEPKLHLGFGAGRNLERIYWSLRTTGQSSPFTSHLIQVASHTLAHLFRPAIVTTLLGRACGLLESKVKKPIAIDQLKPSSPTNNATVHLVEAGREPAVQDTDSTSRSRAA